MASMRDIKLRRNSIQSTQKITKAMKLVATSKLQKAKTRAAESRPFFDKMRETIGSILDKSNAVNHPYLTQREVKNRGYIVITSNKGLAGGYNSNVVKLVMKNSEPNDSKIVAVGKRGADNFRRNGYEILEQYNDVIEQPIYKDAILIGEKMLKMYTEGIIDEVYIAYTSFISALTQEAELIKVLPVDTEEFKGTGEKSSDMMTYEPSPEEVLEQVVPKYINSIIFGALRESVASEHGARMTAMDSATNNATEMIDDLSLEYNRARQASITQELSEIVGGAEALK
ncbi:ATP synthase F1 subunit gamma [Vallitalea guaymasensis]|uniref:ATP synthase gamma chain n=1 Tax=Vallitalea guaymasensis TaxID=1185412 RepID=A0A8J8MAV7_9FIRM|nr:ATP synthase F1 subunit gamma [Vallitalea guaymasensis]QUH29523.1 ATP synthase F1 subunit gamma [Vallitalea guaymasensis]